MIKLKWWNQEETNHSNAVMGYLAPTITILKAKPSKKLDIPAMIPLVQALLNGIINQFQANLNDEKIIVSSILHPKFKETWTSDRNAIEKSNYVIECILDLKKTYT